VRDTCGYHWGSYVSMPLVLCFHSPGVRARALDPVLFQVNKDFFNFAECASSCQKQDTSTVEQYYRREPLTD
jgi:hypothetical protein